MQHSVGLKELTIGCSVQFSQIAIRHLFGKVRAQSLLYQTPHRRHTLCELIVCHLCLRLMVEGIPQLPHFDNVSHLWQGKVSVSRFSWHVFLNLVWQITVGLCSAHCHDLGVTGSFCHSTLHNLRRRSTCDIDVEPHPTLAITSLRCTEIKFEVAYGIIPLAACLGHSNTIAGNI